MIVCLTIIGLLALLLCIRLRAGVFFIARYLMGLEK